MKIRNVDCIRKELRLFMACPKQRQSWKDQTALTCSTPSTGASSQLITRRVSDDTKLLRFTLLRCPEIATQQSSVTTRHVSNCCLSIFTEIKLLIYKQKSSVGVFCRCFTSQYNFCLRNMLSCIEAFVRLRIYLFATCFAGVLLAKLVFSYSFWVKFLSNEE